MSNRIDLTQEELREKLFEWMTKDYGPNQFIDITGEWEVIDEIMDGIEHLGLLAELKRCYDLIDAQKENIEFLNGAIEKLHEETWTEAVMEFVEEHHPSECCDYSHCWKCEEETTSE